MCKISYLKGVVRKWRNAPPLENWLKGMVLAEWPDYESWLFRYAFLSQADWLKQRKASRRFQRKPLLSILTPVYNVSPRFLQECVESVIFQSYPYWEHILVDDGSTRPETLDLLKSLATIDSRVKVHFNQSNQGICKTTNGAIKNAKGEFAVFFDHDDKLAPNALFETVKEINKDPDLDIIYSDRDLISEGGVRFMHLFKPGWAPETILSSNYLCHLTMYRRSLLNAIDGLDRTTEGSQDHDLILRAMETNPKVKHIPKILYHWRQHPESVALNPESKEYAYNAARLSVENALKRRNLTGTVEEIQHLWRGNYRVKLHTMPPTDGYVHRFDDSITVDWFDVFQNALDESAGKPYLVFLGKGIKTIPDDNIDELLSWFQIPEVVMTTGKIVDRDEKIVHAGLLYDDKGNIQSLYQGKLESSAPGYMAWAASVHNVSLVHPGCFAVRREIVQMAVESFNESQSLNLVHFLAVKMLSTQKRIVYTPFARFCCDDATDMVRLFDEKSKEEFYEKWQEDIGKGDPYYSPNLTVVNNDIGLNFSRPAFQLADE